jgi:hypothetical protein
MAWAFGPWDLGRCPRLVWGRALGAGRRVGLMGIGWGLGGARDFWGQRPGTIPAWGNAPVDGSGFRQHVWSGKRGRAFFERGVLRIADGNLIGIPNSDRGHRTRESIQEARREAMVVGLRGVGGGRWKMENGKWGMVELSHSRSALCGCQLRRGEHSVRAASAPGRMENYLRCRTHSKILPLPSSCLSRGRS